MVIVEKEIVYKKVPCGERIVIRGNRQTGKTYKLMEMLKNSLLKDFLEGNESNYCIIVKSNNQEKYFKETLNRSIDGLSLMGAVELYKRVKVINQYSIKNGYPSPYFDLFNIIFIDDSYLFDNDFLSSLLERIKEKNLVIVK